MNVPIVYDYIELHTENESRVQADGCLRCADWRVELSCACFYWLSSPWGSLNRGPGASNACELPASVFWHSRSHAPMGQLVAIRTGLLKRLRPVSIPSSSLKTTHELGQYSLFILSPPRTTRICFRDDAEHDDKTTRSAAQDTLGVPSDDGSDGAAQPELEGVQRRARRACPEEEEGVGFGR